jgi:hypothetical protein
MEISILSQGTPPLAGIDKVSDYSLMSDAALRPRTRGWVQGRLHGGAAIFTAWSLLCDREHAHAEAAALKSTCR